MSALGINRVRRVCPSAADYLAQPARVFDGICTEVGIGHIDGILILSLTPKPSEITKKVYFRLLNVLVSKKRRIGSRGIFCLREAYFSTDILKGLYSVISV